MDNDNYLEHIALFYSEKSKIIGDSPHNKCLNCSSEKYFRETRKELILSCGDDKDETCGIQFKIKLPSYIQKDKEIQKFKEFINEGLNFDILYKYQIINKENFDETKKILEEQQRGIELINERYNKFNLKNKAEKINEFYENRMNLLEDSKKIMKKIKSNEGDKIQNRRDYINIIQKLNDEYKEAQQFLQNINPFIELDEPEIEIVNDDYKETLKSDKKQKKQQKNMFLSDCEKIMCKENIYEAKDFKKWSVKNHPDKFHNLDEKDKDEINENFKTVSNCNDKEEWCPEKKPDNIVYKKPEKKSKEIKQEPVPKEPVPKEPVPKEPVPEEPVPEEPTSEEKELKKPVKKVLTLDDFKEGMNVKWTQYNKEYTGKIGKINRKQKNKINVIWSDGKKKPINIDKLTII